jgi:precorrin isomerase
MTIYAMTLLVYCPGQLENILELLRSARAWFCDADMVQAIMEYGYFATLQGVRDRVESLPVFITSQHSALSAEGNALFTAAGTFRFS